MCINTITPPSLSNVCGMIDNNFIFSDIQLLNQDTSQNPSCNFRSKTARECCRCRPVGENSLISVILS